MRNYKNEDYQQSHLILESIHMKRDKFPGTPMIFRSMWSIDTSEYAPYIKYKNIRILLSHFHVELHQIWWESHQPNVQTEFTKTVAKKNSSTTPFTQQIWSQVKQSPKEANQVFQLISIDFQNPDMNHIYIVDLLFQFPMQVKDLFNHEKVKSNLTKARLEKSMKIILKRQRS